MPKRKNCDKRKKKFARSRKQIENSALKWLIRQNKLPRWKNGLVYKSKRMFELAS